MALNSLTENVRLDPAKTVHDIMKKNLSQQTLSDKIRKTIDRR